MSAVLDKWQVREARQYAEDNKVSYEAALKELFPDEPDEAADEDEGQADEQAPAPKTAAKVDTTKPKS